MKEMIVKKLAEIKVRLDRGSSLIYWARNMAIVAVGLKYLLNLGITNTILVGVCVTIGIYILGLLDLNYLKLYQTEAELTTGKYNPYFRKLKRKI